MRKESESLKRSETSTDHKRKGKLENRFDETSHSKILAAQRFQSPLYPSTHFSEFMYNQEATSRMLISGFRCALSSQQGSSRQKFSLGRFHVPDERPHLDFQRFCGQVGFDHTSFDRTLEENLTKINEMLKIIPQGERKLEKLD